MTSHDNASETRYRQRGTKLCSDNDYHERNDYHVCLTANTAASRGQ